MKTEKEFKKMKEFITAFFAGKNGPVSLLVAPSGFGKTYWAHRIAAEKGFQEYRLFSDPPAGKSYGYVSGVAGDLATELYSEISLRPDGFYVFEDNCFHGKKSRDLLRQLSQGHASYHGKRAPGSVSSALDFSGHILILSYQDVGDIHKEVLDASNVHRVDLFDQPFFSLDIVDMRLESFLEEYRQREGKDLCNVEEAREICKQHRQVAELLRKQGADIRPYLYFNFFKFPQIVMRWKEAATEHDRLNAIARMYQYSFRPPE